MQEPIMYEANELKYETNITFPRIVIDRYRYQDIEMVIYVLQYFFGGKYNESRTYDKDEIIKKYYKVCNEHKS